MAWRNKKKTEPRADLRRKAGPPREVRGAKLWFAADIGAREESAPRTHWRTDGEPAARRKAARRGGTQRHSWIALAAIFLLGFTATLAWLNRARPAVREPVERFAYKMGALSPYQKTSAANVYYPRCAIAHADGVFSIRRGRPGYRPPLDADGDGLACEPEGAETTDMIIW